MGHLLSRDNKSYFAVLYTGVEAPHFTLATDLLEGVSSKKVHKKVYTFSPPTFNDLQKVLGIRV